MKNINRNMCKFMDTFKYRFTFRYQYDSMLNHGFVTGYYTINVREKVRNGFATVNEFAIRDVYICDMASISNEVCVDVRESNLKNRNKSLFI